MNKTEYMLTVLAEECGEIVLEELTTDSKEEDFVQELIDLLAVAEMLEERETIKLPFNTNIQNIYDQRELVIHISQLQYFIFKALRFGLNHKHPKTEILNKVEIENKLDIIFYNFHNFVNLDQMVIEEKKAEKKEKVIRFFKLSKEQGRLK